MFVVALDVCMMKSYTVIYECDTCLSEGIVAHTRTAFGSLLNGDRS
jgi:hypothetical protein